MRFVWHYSSLSTDSYRLLICHLIEVIKEDEIKFTSGFCKILLIDGYLRVMRERQAQAINTRHKASGSPCTTPRSFSANLKSSLGNVQVVNLPALAVVQTDTYELDVSRRFDDMVDVEDISQLQCSLVEDVYEDEPCVINIQERVLKSRTKKLDREQIEEIQFLLDEAAIQKEYWEECLEEIKALKKEVEGYVKKTADEAIQWKTKLFMCKHGLPEQEDDATQCLKQLIGKIEKASQPTTKIPIPKVENRKGNCGDVVPVVPDKPTDQKIEPGDIKPAKSNIKDNNNRLLNQNAKGRYKNIKSKLNTGRQNAGRAKENAALDLRPIRPKVGHTKVNAKSDQRIGRQKVGHTKVNANSDQRTGSQKVELAIEIAKSDQHNGRQKVAHTKEKDKSDQRIGSQKVGHTKEKDKSDQHAGRQNVEHTEENGKIDFDALFALYLASKPKVVDKRWWKRVPHASHKIDCAIIKGKVGKKAIKSKLDTGRSNSLPRKAAVNDGVANPPDIKTRSEGKSSFGNKQPLPQIKKKAATKGQNRNGNNNKIMRTPLPNLKCRSRNGNGVISASSLTDWPRSPVSFGSEKSTPLPPIKSARMDTLGMDLKADADTEDGVNGGVRWITRSLSPPSDNTERKE